jgi:hypothetical protein
MFGIVQIKNQQTELPMNRYEAERFLYNLCLDAPGAEYEMDLVNSDYFLIDLDSNFHELNRLARRVEGMGDFDRETLHAWFKAQPSCTAGDVLRASYNLDRVEFYPGFYSDELLGEHALDSEVFDEYFEEYKGLSTDVFDMLDKAKVGALMREKDGGVFSNGGYLLVRDFPDEELPAEEPLPWFQVRFNNGQDESTWFDVPLCPEDRQILETGFGPENFDSLGMAYRSSLPQLNGLPVTADMLGTLDDLAGTLSGMDGDELLKYKALLEAVQPATPSDALQLAGEMGQYEVTPQYADPEVYGLQHAAYCYSLDADCRLFDFMDLAGYGAEMLLEDGYTQTRYGAVYTEDMELDEVMAEDHTQGFGGMGGLT